MEATEAVAVAKRYAASLFAADEITGLGLEEIDFDYEDDQWKVTVGFFQPWNVEGKEPKRTSFLYAEPEYISRRSYKVVRINDQDGKAVSIRDRLLKWSED